MHIYVYDSFLAQHKYQGILAKIETRITDLGLNGKIIRLNVMKNVNDAIGDELKRGAKTIIAVGNNKTINQALNAMLDFKFNAYSHIPLGIIPIGKNNDISRYLGVLPGEEAGVVLSARRIESLDVGQINDSYFLSRAIINSQETKIEIDTDYSIEIMETGKIKIVNFLPNNGGRLSKNNFNPQDGKIELYIKSGADRGFFRLRPGANNASVFCFDSLNIVSKKNQIILDNAVSLPCPVLAKIAPRKINVIVGRNRRF